VLMAVPCAQGCFPPRLSLHPEAWMRFQGIKCFLQVEWHVLRCTAMCLASFQLLAAWCNSFIRQEQVWFESRCGQVGRGMKRRYSCTGVPRS